MADYVDLFNFNEDKPELKEAAKKEYFIAKHGNTFEPVDGTKLNDEYFAYKSDVRGFGWFITDIASGGYIANNLPSLKACKEYLANLSDEDKAKIEDIKQSPKYKERCEKLADYIATHAATLSMSEAFDLLDDIYGKLDEKKHNNDNKKEQSNKSWRDYFMPISTLGIKVSGGMFTPLLSIDFITAFNDFQKTWSSYDLTKLTEKISRIVSSVDTTGRPRAANSEKVNGIDHPIFELKLGETSSRKPIRALYFTKRDDDGSRYIILASLFIHTDKNLSASERNSGKNAYFTANPKK